MGAICILLKICICYGTSGTHANAPSVVVWTEFHNFMAKIGQPIIYYLENDRAPTVLMYDFPEGSRWVTTP